MNCLGYKYIGTKILNIYLILIYFPIIALLVKEFDTYLHIFRLCIVFFLFLYSCTVLFDLTVIISNINKYT